MLSLGLNIWQRGTSAAAPTIASLFAAGKTGSWYHAYDATGQKVNTDGSGGNVADGAMVGQWVDRGTKGNHMQKWAATQGPLYKAAGYLDFFLRTDGGTTNGMLYRPILASNFARTSLTGGAVVWIPGSEQSAVVDIGGNFAIQTGNRGSIADRYVFDGATFIDTGLRGRARRGYMTWRCDGTTLDVYVDGVLYSRASPTALALSSLYMGRFAGGLPGPMRLMEIVIFDGAFSGAEMTTLNSIMATNASFAGVDPTRTVDVIGDSLSIGTGSDSGVPWHFRPEITNRPNSLWRSSAYGGCYVSSGNRPISNAALIAGKGTNEGVVVIWGGTNDLLTGLKTGVALTTDVVAFSDALRTAGMKVVVCTLQDFTTNRAEKTIYNAGLVTNASHFDGIVRLDLRSELSNNANSTYFTSDAVHLKDAGYAIVASEINAVLAAV